MSFSEGFKNNRNPCRVWLEQKGELFQYWDKEKKENVTVDLDKGFAVLDYELVKVAGYSKKYERNFISNEVRDLRDDLKVVIYMKGNQKEEIATGPWNEIKENLPNGAKYCQSIYIAIDSSLTKINTDDDYIIANIAASGATFGGWLEFFNKVNPSDFQKKEVKVDGYLPKKQGSVDYFEPVFSWGDEIEKHEASRCVDLDITLQEYLGEYLAKGPSAADQHLENQEIAGEENQEIPEEPESSETSKKSTANAFGVGDDEENEEIPEFLLQKLKDGSTLNDKSVEELDSMIEQLNEMGIDPDNQKYKNIVNASKWKKNRELEDDDDIPF